MEPPMTDQQCAVICGLTNGERQETCGACPDYMTTDQQQEARWRNRGTSVYGPAASVRSWECATEADAQRCVRLLNALDDHDQADAAEALRAENAELRRGGEFVVSKANEYSQLADDWRRRAEAAELRAEALATALEDIRINADLAAGPEDTSLQAIVELAQAALDAHRAEAPKKN